VGPHEDDDEPDPWRKSDAGSTGRRGPRWQEIHALLVVVANQMFEEVGYDDAKTRDIAARSKVSQATLFRHFETKADLALFHLRREVDRLVAAVVGRPGDESPYRALLAVMGDSVVLAALTSPAVQMEGERLARHPELAAHVYWMISDVRQQLAVNFAARLGVGERSPRACVLANVVVDIATYTMEESFERARDPGAILLAALEELRPLLDPAAVSVGSGC
jgi:AcrR family transcriptional regulator